MKRIKKIISILFLLVMIASVLPYEGSAISVSQPSQSVTSSKYFTAFPGVYEMGDGYAVIWATNFKGTGYIQYKYNGTTYTVYDMKNGIVRTGDTIHVVKVPYEHLQGNSYTVYSAEVTSHSSAITNYGTTISAGPITLKAFDGNVSNFDILVLTDTHGQKDWTVDMASRFSGTPDLVVFGGDIEDKLDEKSDIANMFNIMGSTTRGQYPIVYCRGNHEIRDVYSTVLLEYFPTKTGEFYFDFTYGPLWAVVMDTGEDKDDGHEYYGNLANYTEYHQKQEAWLRSLRRNTKAKFRLSINHIPNIHTLPNGVDYSDSIGHLGIQFAVSGHKHWTQIYGSCRSDYAAVIDHETMCCGGYAANSAVWVKFSGNYAYLTTQRGSGSNTTVSGTNVIDSSKYYINYSNYKVALSNSYTSNPSALTPQRGVNNHFNPSTSSKGTVWLETQPAVFESGGDWYNVVWKTGDSGSAEGVTGYVEYTYNGTNYQMFEEAGGYRRTCDDFHTVKIPKEHLNNNTYRVGSFLMEYASTSSGGRYYTAGDWVESRDYLFENKAEDSTVSIVACPDLELSSASARLNNAKNAVAGLGTSPAYVVLNGNVAADALYGGNELTYLLNAAATVSGSIHPVILSRGFTECRGATAANLLKYIPTATGEFYYTVDVGDYTLVNLDTAEDQADSAKAVYNGKNVSKYGNRVFFDSYRKNQLSWINSLPSGKLIAVSSTPLSEVSSVFGLNYEQALKNKGAVLAISGHNSSFSLDSTVNSSKIYTVNPGGRSDSKGTDVVSVLLSDDYAYITDCNSNNSTTTYPTQTAVSLSSGATLSQSTEKPPQVNGVYEVSTPAHLRWISANCTSASSFSGESFKMVNDIDLQLVPFTPIGGNDTASSDSNTTSSGFAGTFDGNGYTIKNLNIASSGKNYVGLFGIVRKGTVKNVTLSGGMVSGGWYVGGLVGAAYNVSVVQNCYNDVTVYSAAGTKVGGIAGFLSGGSQISCCANFGSISAGHTSGSVAGIVGQIHGSTTNTITGCFNRGSIAAHGTSGNAGGIFGYAGSVSAAISNCYNAAPVASCGSAGTIMASYSSSGKLTVKNTYFANGYNGATMATGSSNTWRTASGSGTISGKSQASMKSQSFANTLSSSEFVYDASANEGYPIHKPCAAGHCYAQTVTNPTCTTAGSTTYVCTKCGASYTDNVVAATGHSYTYQLTTTPSTQKTGVLTGTCTVCAGTTKVTLPVCSTTNYTQETIKAPTCTAEGTCTWTWKDTTYGTVKFTTSTAATGHSYEYQLTTTPSTEKTGVLTGTCTVCSGTTTVTLPVCNTTDYTRETTKASTCTAEGICTWTWKDTTYGTVKFTTSVATTEHSYTYKVTTTPSTKKTGVLTGTCANCSGTTTVTLPVRNTTNYTKVKTKAPTCTAKGTYTWTWKDTTYGTVKLTTSIAATGHSYTYKITTKPSTKKTGVLTGTCANCSGTTTVTLPVRNTTNYTKVKTKAPTCTAKGTYTWTWKDTTYGTVKWTTSIAATGHSYEYELTTAPSTEKTGVLTGTCTACSGTTTVTLPVCNTTDYTKETTKASTCTAEGTDTWTWKDTTYGTVQFTTSISATGHSYEYQLTAEPSTETTGVLTGTCTACSDTTTVTLPVCNTMDYTRETTKAPTCTAEGTDTWTWKDATYGTVKFTTSIEATGHSYTYKVTKNPTSKKTGVLTGTCTECSGTTTVTLPLANTTNYKKVKTKAPTCTAKGTYTWTWKYTTYGTVKFTSSIAATGHSYEYQVTTTPSSEKTGVLTGTCTKCSGTTTVTLPVCSTTDYTQETTVAPTCTAEGTDTWTWKDTTYGTVQFTTSIDATGHSYTYKITTKPTSKKTGVLTGTCTECSGTTTVTLPLANTTNYKKVKTKAPTCTAKGTYTWTWKDTTYGTVKWTTSIAATGHSYDYQVTKTPTTSKKGKLTGVCSSCGETVTVTLPKLNTTDYSYEVTKAATSTKKGVGVYTWNTTDYGTFRFEASIPKTSSS